MTIASEASSNRQNLDVLTSIRFFAAMAVVMFHSGAGWVSNQAYLPNFISVFLLNGYLGVTFFFVLSGFILQFVYRLTVINKETARGFAIARFARIYPVYILAIACMVPLVGSFEQGWYLQFALLQRWVPTTIWDVPNWNMPAWTLSVEMLFYILFLPISNVVNRSSNSLIFIAVIVCGLFLIATGSSSVWSNNDAAQSWMEFVPVALIRLPEFVLGIMICEIYMRGFRINFRHVDVLILALMILLMASSNSKFVAGPFTCLAALLIFVLASSTGGFIYTLLTRKVLILLGASSYALYLLHQPVHFLILQVSHSKIVLLLQYPVVMFASIMIFKYYEQPCRVIIRKIFGN